MNPTPEMIAEASRLWAYMPYRRCWIAQKEGENHRVLCEVTARRANMLVKEGWMVMELKREVTA